MELSFRSLIHLDK